MCFFLTHHGKELTADKDIKVFKVIYKTGESMHFDHVYELGEKQPEIDLEVFIDLSRNYRVITKGYHSFLTEKRAFQALLNWNYFYSDSFKIALFTIPKGAKYYTNRKTGERVSSTIIFNGFSDQETTKEKSNETFYIY